MEDYDHPAVAAALVYGYPRRPRTEPRCPICGGECETVYKNRDGDAAGCDLCADWTDGTDKNCPICGGEREVLYFNTMSYPSPVWYIGCDKCITRIPAWKYQTQEELLL